MHGHQHCRRYLKEFYAPKRKMETSVRAEERGNTLGQSVIGEQETPIL